MAYNGYPAARPPPGYSAPQGYSQHSPYSSQYTPGFIQGTVQPPLPPYMSPGAPPGSTYHQPYYSPPPAFQERRPYGGPGLGKGGFGKGLPPPPLPVAGAPWVCPHCTRENYGYRDRCFSCHAPRQFDGGFGGPGEGWRMGDWLCPVCQMQNFAKRMQCFQCGTPKPEYPGAPPPKRKRLREGEYPPTHPCVRVFGFCKAAATCPFQDYPSNACLLFLKGKCRFGERCLETHYRQEPDGSFVAVQENITESLPPPPEGCHPCVRVYGFCKLGNICHFASLPKEACLMHLKGRCRFGDSCKERHLTQDELATYFPGGQVPQGPEGFY